MAAKAQLKRLKKAKKSNNTTGSRPTSGARLTSEAPFQIVEAYKSLRTNILYTLAGQKNKIIIVTSSLPREGKSTTSSNLAITMAQTESKVLLIDADLRKPIQHQIFKKPNHVGLSSLLVGFNTSDEVIINEVEPNLDLIPSGPLPPNPSELLGSENMSTQLNILCEQYDYIFIDTPPINVVTDAMVLADKAAGIMLVTRQGTSTYDELDRAVGTIQFAGANILGIVVNGIQDRSSGYGGYKYKYSYKYGYSSSKQAE